MSNLKDLVPPPGLCKLIPAGEFEDSALMCEATLGMASRQVLDVRIIPRQKITNNPYVDRKLGREYYIYPAPTLQEIMAELPASNIYRIKQTWTANFINDSVSNGITSRNAATAALKLWLELKGLKHERDQRNFS